MKAAWDACEAAGVSPPPSVSAFFNDQEPGDAPGMEVDIEGGAATELPEDGVRMGFQVDIEALPDGVRYVGFFCSW